MSTIKAKKSIETYTGIMIQDYLIKLPFCTMIVEKYHKNTIVTECDAMIVGFLAYMVPNDYLSYTGEVRSINILKSHQKIEIEKTLIYEGIRRLNRFSNITV